MSYKNRYCQNTNLLKSVSNPDAWVVYECVHANPVRVSGGSVCRDGQAEIHCLIMPPPHPFAVSEYVFETGWWNDVSVLCLNLEFCLVANFSGCQISGKDLPAPLTISAIVGNF